MTLNPAEEIASGVKSLFPGQIPRIYQGTIVQTYVGRTSNVVINNDIVTGVFALDHVQLAAGLGCWVMSLKNGRWIIIGTRADSTGPAARRNMVRNGCARVYQRNAAVTVANSAANGIDGWRIGHSGSGSATLQRSSGVGAPWGFIYAFIASTDATLDAGDYTIFGQHLEGRDIAHLRWGDGAAKPATLSFTARTNVTGTYSVAFRNAAASRSYVTTFDVTAGINNYVTLPIPGSADGTWPDDISSALSIYWCLGAGSTYQTSTLNTWLPANYLCANTQTNLRNTLNGYLMIGQVQFEPGGSATPFEIRPYSEELLICQRYLYIIGGASAFETLGVGWQFATTASKAWVPFPTTMRATPTLSSSGNTEVYANQTNLAYAVSAINMQANQSSPNTACVDLTNAVSAAAASPVYWRAANSTSVSQIFTAEMS